MLGRVTLEWRQVALTLDMFDVVLMLEDVLLLHEYESGATTFHSPDEMQTPCEQQDDDEKMSNVPSPDSLEKPGISITTSEFVTKFIVIRNRKVILVADPGFGSAYSIQVFRKAPRLSTSIPEFCTGPATAFVDIVMLCVVMLNPQSGRIMPTAPFFE